MIVTAAAATYMLCQHTHTNESASTMCTRAHDHEHESTSTRWPGNQCEPSAERPAKPVRHFFNMYVGLHAPGWLYVLGMPPRDYLASFATLNSQSTYHGSQPGPTLAPWCTGGLHACLRAESTRKDPRPEEKKMQL